MSEADETTSLTSSADAWTDVFFGVLVAPKETLTILSKEAKHEQGSRSLLKAAALVFIAVLLAALSKTGLELSTVDQMQLSFIIFSAILQWIFLGAFLFFLGKVMDVAGINFAASLVVTGWAYLPLVFLPTVRCLSIFPLIGGWLLFFVSLWMYSLEWHAFAALLELTHKRMALLALAVPFILSCLGWNWFFLSIFLSA
ncbi:MAG TPA: YIP1 family protein [Candidatus Obscuribacterales bacterium]